MQQDKHENFDYVVDKRKEKLTPIGEKINLKSEILGFYQSKTWLRHMILELRHRDKTRMP
jgi:hypothetical protein